ncbi:DUF5050 domain-containing protein, partial [Candidatus Dependentiae bacterium]|nr:DUF5050 domain-containing protein [Candidatus Dependentiae bacterium]
MKKLILVFLGVLLILSLNVFGDKVIFSSGDKPADSFYIYSMNIDGSKLIQLSTNIGYNPTVSPDKRMIAYAGRVTDPYQRNEIFIMNIDGSNVRQLTYNYSPNEASQPTWSPDGQWIYYRRAYGDSEIRKINIDGTQDTLVIHVDHDGSPQVSPDNQYIYFHSHPNWTPNDTIRRIDIDGSNLITIYGSDGEADNSPQIDSTGTQMLLSTSENGAGYNPPINLYILDISSGFKFPIFSLSGNEDYHRGKYSLDGTKIVYSYSADYTLGDNSYELWMCDLDGTNKQQLTSNAIWDAEGVLIENNNPFLDWTGEVNYSFDGLDPEVGNNATNFTFRIDYFDFDNDAPLAGHPQVHISDGGGEISGSPFSMMDVDPGDTTYTDGKLYTYSTTLPAGSSYTYIFEAKDEHYFANYDSTTYPIAGPNVNAPVTGYRVIFFSGDETISSWNIFSMNIDGSDLQQLTTNNSSTSQSINPNNTKIAYTNTSDGEIWLMNLDGSDKTQLTNTTVGKACEPCWSPDGEWIYYANIENPVAGQSSIRKIKKDGTGDIFINQIYDDRGPMISPDNLYVYFRSEPGTQSNDTIRRMDIDGSNLITILASDANADYRPGLSPNGTEIIVATAAFGDSEPQNLYIIDISSGSKSPIFTRVGNETYRQGTFFDNGNKIIFNYSSDHTVNNSHNLWISDKDGSNKQQITNNSNSDRKAIIIENNSVPTLTYTGEVNYISDGLDP